VVLLRRPSARIIDRTHPAADYRDALAPQGRRERAGTVVGRVGAPGHLRELMASAADGRGASVLIAGEPGIGKSTLLSSTLAEAAGRGFLVLRGAPDAEGGLTLQSVVSAITATGTDIDSQTTDAGPTVPPDPRQQFPPLRFSLPVTGAHCDPAAAVGAVLAAVERMCAATPVLLAVDDLHRADPDALLLWHRLGRAAPRLPLLLVACSRPTAPSGAPDRLRRALVAEGNVVLRLEPFTPAEVAAMATALLGAPPGAQLRRRLEAAGGNPAFVRDLIESLRRGNGLRIEGRIAESTAEAAAGPIPAALVEAVCGRLGPLSADTLDLLRLASLLGEEFTGRELAAVAGLEPSELLCALDEVICAGVLAEHGPRLRFRHALVCQALRHSLRETRRSALHRSAAQALDAAGAPVERVAEQLLTAAALAQGWPAQWLAAKADELTFRAPELAVELFRRAIDHAAPDDPHRLLFEEKLASAMYLLGRSDCAPAALGLLEYRADPVRRTTWAYMSGIALNRVGRYAQGLDAVKDGVEALQNAAGSLPAGFAELWSARFTGLRSQLVWSQGQRDEARGLADRALAEGLRLGDPLALFYGTHMKSLLCAGDGDAPGALAWIEQGLAALGERWQLADQRLLMMMNQAVALGRLDRAAEAHAVLGRAQEVAERCGVTRRLAGIVFLSTSLLYLTGRWDESVATARPMIDHADAGRQRSLLAAVRALILLHRGRAGEAREDLATVQREHGRLDGRLERFPVLASSLSAEADGRAADALAALAPALAGDGRWDSDERHWCLPDLTRLALAAGDGGLARSAAEAAEADADQDAANTRRRASAQRCRGLLDNDQSLLSAAAEYYRSVDMPLLLAQTLEDSAVVAAALGAADDARRHLEAAAEGYRALGASWDLARADARLREFGIRRGRRTGRTRPDTGWEALTPAEAKVASLVAQGSSNPEIAALLYLSPRTVQTHVSHILTKLGVHSRSEIAREAARRVPGASV